MMNKLFKPIAILLLFSIPAGLMAQQHDQLRSQIATIAKPIKGIVGVSILNLEDKDTVTFNGNARLVMHSVFKLPIALCVLHLVDSGIFKLDQMVHLTKKDMRKNTWSPLTDKYPKGDIDVSFADLLGYMVSQSDNNACDILINQLGSPEAVQAYLQRNGIKSIGIEASEADMASAWEVQYTNWCKPTAMTLLLDKFYSGKLLSKPSTDFLYKLMTETTTGPKRIKALLPPGTIVAHKTGTSPTNAAGLSPATNDVGIITLPNGKHLAIAIFVCNSTNDEATREGVIANIAKAAWDAYGK